MRDRLAQCCAWRHAAVSNDARGKRFVRHDARRFEPFCHGARRHLRFLDLVAVVQLPVRLALLLNGRTDAACVLLVANTLAGRVRDGLLEGVLRGLECDIVLARESAFEEHAI